MKLKRVILVSLLIFILLISVTISHFFAPNGILIVPIVMSGIVALTIFTKTTFSIVAKSVLSYLFIGLNDIGIKLFSGGRHDMARNGWIHMMLFIGVGLCLVILLIGVFNDKKSNFYIKILSVIIFVVFIYLHVEIFESLGVIRNPI
jgi:hypothetical protein